MNARDARRKLKQLASPDVAKVSRGFFKTGPGEYGEGDVFIGIRVPVLRSVAREFRELPLPELAVLLASSIHEERHFALIVLALQCLKSDEERRQAAFDFYLAHTQYINNWDLVDTSAPQVVGGYLFDKPREPLYRLAQSRSLWERRIAMVATQFFIRQGDFADTLKLAELYLNAPEDLIHKASGWMLREVGQKDTALLEAFLNRHVSAMPRTMLRYAIERLPPDKRKSYLQM